MTYLEVIEAVCGLDATAAQIDEVLEVLAYDSWAPQHAIWFQRKGDVKAFVSLVNDLYRYEIFSKYGKQLAMNSEKTLELAKKAVFDYFEKEVVEAAQVSYKIKQFDPGPEDGDQKPWWSVTYPHDTGYTGYKRQDTQKANCSVPTEKDAKEFVRLHKLDPELASKFHQKIQLAHPEYFTGKSEAAARTVHFYNKHITFPENDKACFTEVNNPEVTDDPKKVTCKQCKYLMRLNHKEWKIKAATDIQDGDLVTSIVRISAEVPKGIVGTARIGPGAKWEVELGKPHPNLVYPNLLGLKAQWAKS